MMHFCPLCGVERADFEASGLHLATCPNCGSAAEPAPGQDLDTFDTRVAALNAAVAFTGVVAGGRQLDMQEAARAVAATLGTAERFEQWLTRPATSPAQASADEPVPPLALGRTDG
jgi:hypothetical protein